MGLIIFELNHPQYISVIPWGFFHLGISSSDSFSLHSQGSIPLPPKIRASCSSLPERTLCCAFTNVADLLILMLIGGKIGCIRWGGGEEEIRVSAHLLSSVQQIVGSRRGLGKDRLNDWLIEWLIWPVLIDCSCRSINRVFDGLIILTKYELCAVQVILKKILQIFQLFINHLKAGGYMKHHRSMKPFRHWKIRVHLYQYAANNVELWQRVIGIESSPCVDLDLAFFPESAIY